LKKLVLACLLFAGLIMCGCIGSGAQGTDSVARPTATAAKFVCFDGSVADSPVFCPVQQQKIVQVNITRYVCSNGSVESTPDDCKQGNTSATPTNEVSPPVTDSGPVNLTIFSISDSAGEVHNPIIIVGNQRATAVTDLIIDAELYRDNTLILAESPFFMSGGPEFNIKSIPPNQSVRGYLNLFWYSRVIPQFFQGNYRVKISVRMGSNPVPLTSDERTVAITR